MDVEQALRDEFQSDEWGSEMWSHPALRVRQALRRRRQARAAVAATLVVFGGVGLGVGLGVTRGGGGSGTQTIRPAQPASSPLGHAVPDSASATGLAGVGFGTSRTAALNQFEQSFGQPRRLLQAQPLPAACGIDSDTVWHGMTVYFFHQRFVGYIYAGLKTGDGRVLKGPTGLHIGESLARAKSANGTSLHTLTGSRRLVDSPDGSRQARRKPDRSPPRRQNRKHCCWLTRVRWDGPLAPALP
jgi:hypothetical protein